MNKHTPRLALASVVALSALSGCATVTPPPTVMALEGASRGPAGSTAVTAYGGVNGGVFLSSGVGGGARFSHRVS